MNKRLSLIIGVLLLVQVGTAQNLNFGGLFPVIQPNRPHLQEMGIQHLPVDGHQYMGQKRSHGQMEFMVSSINLEHYRQPKSEKSKEE